MLNIIASMHQAVKQVLLIRSYLMYVNVTSNKYKTILAIQLKSDSYATVLHSLFITLEKVCQQL